jgi:hypothetical protein
MTFWMTLRNERVQVEANILPPEDLGQRQVMFTVLIRRGNGKRVGWTPSRAELALIARRAASVALNRRLN